MAPPSWEALQSLGITRDSLQLKEQKEISMQATTDIDPKAQTPVIDINRYSSYTQLVRVTAWVFRVVTRSNLFSSTPLSVMELSKAKAWLIKQA